MNAHDPMTCPCCRHWQEQIALLRSQMTGGGTILALKAESERLAKERDELRKELAILANPEPEKKPRRIKLNRIRCKKCDDVITSETRHDFRRCSCDSVFVDGGNDYLRRGWTQGSPEDSYEELSEFEGD